MVSQFINIVNTTVCEAWIIKHGSMHQRYWPITLASMILAFVNMTTNTIAFVIFCRGSADSILNNLLMALSLCEVVFQLFYFIHLFIDLHLLLLSSLIFSSFNKILTFVGGYLWIIIPALTASHISRNWMVVMISCYRYEVLIRAFSKKWILFRKERITLICWVIVFLAVIISIPRIAERNMIYCKIEDLGNNSDTKYILIGLGQWLYSYKSYYTYGYSIVTLFLFQNGGPTCLVCFVSIMIVLKLRERIRARIKLRNFKIKETNNCNSLKEKSYSWSWKEIKFPSLTNNSRNPTTAIDKNSTNEITILEKCPFTSNKSDNPQLGEITEETACTSPQTQLVKSLNQSKRKFNSSNRKNSGGRLIIMLCILFCICEMPLFISKFNYGVIVFFGTKMNVTTEILGIIANVATALDSFANIFIYLLSNRQFRFLLWDLFFNDKLCSVRMPGSRRI